MLTFELRPLSSLFCVFQLLEWELVQIFRIAFSGQNGLVTVLFVSLFDVTILLVKGEDISATDHSMSMPSSDTFFLQFYSFRNRPK